jgi:hypothetical protein
MNLWAPQGETQNAEKAKNDNHSLKIKTCMKWVSFHKIMLDNHILEFWGIAEHC